MTYRQAAARAIAEEMSRDSRVVLLGEDVAAAGGVFKATEGLLEAFGPERVRDTPISEQAIIGAAIGASINGLRPVAELMFADFAGVAFDQIANQLAKYRYMTGGQVKVPVTIRLVGGAGLGFGAQHSQLTENWFLNIPGLQMATPGTPADLLGLLKTAIRSDDPVLVFEHKALYSLKAEVPDGEVLVPLGSATVVIEGNDLTILATQVMRQRAEKAARALNARGISVELIDPRSLVPFDFGTVQTSVRKTGRVLVVQESPFSGSWGATIVAQLATECFTWLNAAPAIVCAPNTPIPFAENLERRWIPTEQDILEAAMQLLGGEKQAMAT
jgi:acetoin:2,6-dichlorophenolindophenol oxidoreductase subunit beta